MSGTGTRTAAATLSLAMCCALLMSGCGGGEVAGPTGSPFKTSSSTARSATTVKPVTTSGTRSAAPATETVSQYPTTAAQPRASTRATTAGTSTEPDPEMGRSTADGPESTRRLDYSSVPAPPTPIGASGVPSTTPTMTMQTVLPEPVDPAPFAPISRPTRLGKPATVSRIDPVQVAAAFVTLMESPRAMDSNADNATLRATPLATDELAHQLLTKAPPAATDRPPAGYVQVTVRQAYVTRVDGKDPEPKLTVAVLYQRITILTPAETFNAQTFLLRMVTLERNGSSWVVTNYLQAPN